MAKKQRALISEDAHSFLVHDGEKHFAIAKRGIAEDLHDKIRKLPKYAQGGVVEGGEIPDATPVPEIPSTAPEPDRSPASFDGQSHPIMGMLPNFMFNDGVNPYSADAPQTVPTPAAAPDTANPALIQGPTPASAPTANVLQPTAPGTAELPKQPDVLGGFQGAGKQYVKGLGEEQKAQSDLGKAEADVYKNMFPPEFEADLKTRFSELQKERVAAKADLDKTREAAFQGKEDPNRLWHNMSTGNKVMASIALILGGAGSGGNANNNAALNTLNSAIDRDVQAQRNDKANSQNLYKANLERYKDADTAIQMTTLQLKTVAEGKLMAAAAMARDPLAKAKLDQAAGMFQRQNVIEGENVYQQQANRKLLQSLNGPAGQNMNSAVKVRILAQTGAIPKEQVEPTYKELDDAKNLKDLHDEGMKIFDKVAELNTVGNKMNPQARAQIAALRDPFLDKLTKDTSGRVTPETVKLVEQAFAGAIDNPKTTDIKRENFHNFLLNKANFSHLDAVPGLNPLSNMVYARPARGVSKGK